MVTNEVVQRIAERLGRTPAQTVLQWHIQRGDIIFPRSNTPAHIADNIRLFDFELAADDLAAMTALNRGTAGRKGPEPDTLDWVPAEPASRRVGGVRVAVPRAVHRVREHPEAAAEVARAGRL